MIDSTNNMNNFTDLSITTTAHKVRNENFFNLIFLFLQSQDIEAVSERAPKRGVPDQREDELKKAKTDYHSTAEHISSVAPKFVSAAEIAATTSRSNIQAMPEISDEELLEMAIKFEREHPE